MNIQNCEISSYKLFAVLSLAFDGQISNMTKMTETALKSLPILHLIFLMKRMQLITRYLYK